MKKKFKVLIGVLVILALLIIFYARIPTKCVDLKCFVAKANNCMPATYEETTAIGTIDYSVSANSGDSCALTKQVVALDKKENDFVKKLLENKLMVCIYSKNQFNGQWITSLIEGLDNCEGNLKDAVGQLLLLVDVK